MALLSVGTHFRGKDIEKSSQGHPATLGGPPATLGGPHRLFAYVWITFPYLFENVETDVLVVASSSFNY